jgi:hypothetical protein
MVLKLEAERMCLHYSFIYIVPPLKGIQLPFRAITHQLTV